MDKTKSWRDGKKSMYSEMVMSHVSQAMTPNMFSRVSSNHAMREMAATGASGSSTGGRQPKPEVHVIGPTMNFRDTMSMGIRSGGFNKF